LNIFLNVRSSKQVSILMWKPFFLLFQFTDDRVVLTATNR